MSLWIPAIASGVSALSGLFGKKEKAPEYRYEEPEELKTARSQLYSKLFTSPVAYEPFSAAQKQRYVGDIETQARKGAEDTTFGVSRRGFRPEVGATSFYDTMLQNIAGEEAKQKAYLGERIAEIESGRKAEAETQRVGQQLGFYGGETARAGELASKRYAAESDIYGREEAGRGTPLKTLGQLSALFLDRKGGASDWSTAYKTPKTITPKASSFSSGLIDMARERWG